MSWVRFGLLVLITTASCHGTAIRADASSTTSGSGGAGGSVPTGGNGGTVPGDDAAGPVDEAGSGSEVGANTSDAGTALEPIHVFGGTWDASVYYDLRIVGSGLDLYEGALVTFRIGTTSGVYRNGSGQTRIVQGGFDVFFPGVINPTYEQKLIHIDANGNGACDDGEPAFIDFSPFEGDATLTVTPTDVRFRQAPSGWCDNFRTLPVE
jgi:hypothetical protein